MFAYCVNNSVNNSDPRGEMAIAAGLYFIPGIGEVAIAATGAIIVGGLVIWTGSYLAKTIINYVKNFSKASKNRTVSDILKTKKGTIKNAPLPPGSPSWNSIMTLTLAEIQRRAQRGDIGYGTIYKLLTDSRFNK